MGTGMKMRPIVQTVVLLFLVLFLSGCASCDGGQALSGVLMGIGQGLSGL